MAIFVLLFLLLIPPAHAYDGDYTQSELAQLTRNAQSGDAEAEYELGMAYHDGVPGLAKSDRQAVKWFKKAAEQGEMRAQYNLAIAYYRGLGTAKNLDKAVKWFMAAAKQGSPDAAYAVAASYARGVGGLPLDNVQAYVWLKRASDGGIKAAGRDLEGLKETMSVEQLGRAEKLAQDNKEGL